ncbi:MULTISPECIES: hypothetical protein [unclassified Streptomyces]|uniref:hypothetical protein n=1 Tax=unclassified Streptomyces TaxID=2593676 RepID=UPI002481A0A2|nr:MULTISPECIES: hypothetical protein [unclassified Streptomyces]MDA5280240.1 hypothetical protein [Streptomyces sp. Isolate_45]MDX2388582.1 hypothetical protein [Streptomyces sp. DK15]
MIVKRAGRRLVVISAVPAAVFLTLGLSGPALADEGKAYQIDLAQLNDSGSRGTVMLSLKGKQLTVRIESEGMVPGQPSAQHLHGSTKGHDFHCPDASDDTNGDGILNNTEATVDYGDINISLTTSGETKATSGLAVERMPVADKAGKLSYQRTITVGQDVVDHIKDLHVVQHGIDRNDNDKYDFDGAGKSELDPKLPQEATAPTNCGEVKGAAVGSIPVGAIETGGGSPEDAAVPLATTAGAAVLAYAAMAGAMTLLRKRATVSPGPTRTEEDAA